VFLLRLVAILVVVAIGVGIVLFLLTGNRRHLSFALQLLKWAVVFALLVFGLLVLERLVVLV
jgi:hypothetical protein